MSAHFHVGVAASSSKFDDDDDRWREQVAVLIQGLRAESDELRIARTAVPGTKGTVDELIVTLGSSGVFTAVVEVVRSWLARDQTRAIDLTYRGRDGLDQTLHVVATHATDEVFAPVLAAIASQITDV